MMPIVLMDRLCPKLIARIYVVIALCFGTLFVFLTPPNGAPDEASHQVKIARIAGGNLFDADKNLTLPSIPGWYGRFSDSAMIRMQNVFSIGDLKEVAFAPLDCKPANRNQNDSVAAYSPLLYIAPTLAYLSACSSGSSFGFYLYSARAANLILSISLTALGIALCEVSAWPIFIVSLLPCVVYQAASVSADSILFGLAAAYVGLIVGIASGRLDLQRVWLPCVVAGILISFSKPTYSWMTLLSIVILPKWRHKDWSWMGFAVCFIALPILAQAALLYMARGSAPVVGGLDPDQNLRAFAEHPFDFLRKLWQVPIAYPPGSTWNIGESFVGKLGYLNVPLPRPVYLAAYCGVAVSTACCTAEGQAFCRRDRFFTLALALFSFFIVSLPLYIYATAPNSPAVFGLQGRYFIPTAFIALSGLSFSSGVAPYARIASLFIALVVLGASVASASKVFYGY